MAQKTFNSLPLFPCRNQTAFEWQRFPTYIRFARPTAWKSLLSSPVCICLPLARSARHTRLKKVKGARGSESIKANILAVGARERKGKTPSAGRLCAVVHVWGNGRPAWNKRASRSLAFSANRRKQAWRKGEKNKKVKRRSGGGRREVGNVLRHDENMWRGKWNEQRSKLRSEEVDSKIYGPVDFLVLDVRWARNEISLNSDVMREFIKSSMHD